MNINTKMSVSVDIIDTVIAKLVQGGEEPNSQAIISLKNEKQEIFNFNEAVMDKVIAEYGDIIKRGEL